MLPKTPPIVTLTKQEVQRIETKQKQRQALREYIIKERSNPFKAPGLIPDPMYMRYEASQSFFQAVKFYKFNMSTVGWFCGVVAGPMVAIFLYATYTRNEFDGRCRRGEIAYKDRNNKFA